MTQEPSPLCVNLKDFFDELWSQRMRKDDADRYSQESREQLSKFSNDVSSSMDSSTSQISSALDSSTIPDVDLIEKNKLNTPVSDDSGIFDSRPASYKSLQSRGYTDEQIFDSITRLRNSSQMLFHSTTVLLDIEERQRLSSDRVSKQIHEQNSERFRIVNGKNYFCKKGSFDKSCLLFTQTVLQLAQAWFLYFLLLEKTTSRKYVP